MKGAGLDQVLGILRGRRASARTQFGVEIVGVVGSVARGEQRTDSDIDVVVRAVGKVTLFDLVRLQDALAGDLERPVDFVFTEQMAADRRAHIERDLVKL
jgi:predicted nucleotidyltransferase